MSLSRPWRHIEEAEVQLHSFSTPALEEVIGKLSTVIICLQEGAPVHVK